MTISSTTNRVSYTGNGVTTAFAFGYKFLVNADLKVYQAGTLKTITTHYTVTGAGDDAGGTVTFLSAPANGESVVILRDPAITQGLDLVENDSLPAEDVEDEFDKLTMISQRLDDRLDRAIVLDDTDTSGASLILPSPVADEFIKWNGAGTGLESSTVVGLGAIGVPVIVSQGGTGSATAAGARTNLGLVIGTDVQAQQYISVTDPTYGADNTGVADSTSAIQAAIDAAGPNGMVYFPAGTYKVTGTVTVSEHRVHLVGAGPWATKILFAPTANGTCFKFSAGAAVLYQGSVSKMSFYSNDSTYVKVALEVIDTSCYVFEDIVVSGSVEAVPGSSCWADATNASVGILLKGRETGTVTRFTAFANRPIQISQNPNSSIDIDHFHFEDTYLGAANNPCVTIDDGVNLTNVTFDGSNAWVLGTHGLYWNDTTSVGVSTCLNINNVRTEQGQDTTKYGIYIAHNTGLQMLQVRNFQGGANTDRNSFYLRKCENVYLDSCFHAGNARTALDVNATVKRITVMNCFWQTSAPVSIVGQRTVYESPRNPSAGPISPNAIYNESSSTTRNTIIGGAISEELVTLADDATYSIGPTGTAGMLLVTDSEGLGAIYLLRGTANTVNEISDPVGVFQPSDSDTYNCIFWDAGSSAYVLKNRRGGTRRYKITLIGSYSTF